MSKKVLSASLAIAIGAAACAHASGITGDDLTAHSWMSSAPVSKECEIPSMIKFEKDGKFTAEPGCNNMFGEYVIGKDGAFKFDNVGMTRKMCAAPYMEQEGAFVKMINETRYAELKDGKIRFFDGDRKELGGIEKEKAGACG